MNIEALQDEYAAGRTTPVEVMEDVLRRVEAQGQHPIWITLVPRAEVLAQAVELAQADREKLPLFGIPFAVKDNIDVAGLPTTAGCPGFAYTPDASATVVQKLQAAGAILIGKTNMDQFATGLVGTRSPYGACSSVFGKEWISGGSSSGSAVAVAGGLVSFALGTDTAGSGRVPAMFNNLVGLKPSIGVLSAHGIVPACRSLDCVSIFAGTAADAALVLASARGHDPQDSYSRHAPPPAGAWADPSASFRFGVPAPAALQWFGDELNPALFQQAVATLTGLGGTAVEFDLAPFLAAAKLLYNGPWVAERTAAIGPFLAGHRDAVDPTVASIIAGGERFSAVDTFNAIYQLQALRQATAAVWDGLDVLLLPTAPRTYTHAEIAEAPIERNSHLGTYTNFVNLMDLAAIAVPAGMRGDGLPFGVSLIAPAFSEAALLALGDRLHRRLGRTVGGSTLALAETRPVSLPSPPPGTLLIAVVGAHLSGQPLNWQLTQRGGRLLRTCRSHPDYKLYALSNTAPAKPGLVRVPDFKGPGIEVEVWALPSESVGSFVDGIPQPLGIGKLRLEDGTLVMGFIAEPAATEGATEITHFGGWRAYLKSLQ